MNTLPTPFNGQPSGLKRLMLFCLGIASAMILGGCASTIRLENEVQSYAAWDSAGLPAPKQGDLYRFERLPSQSQGRTATLQDQLEQLARQSLEKKGLLLGSTEGAASPMVIPWTVKVSARTTELPDPYGDDRRFGWPYWSGGYDYYLTRTGHLVMVPLFPMPSIPRHQREVTLTIHDARNGKVVYETRAVHDGPWNDTPALWSALLDAALEGFPAPPRSPRRVIIEIPR